MNNEPRKQLLEIVKIFGIEVLEKPRILEGLLKDFCRNSKKEIFSIVIASKEGFVKQLTINDNNENFPQYNKIVSLSHKLQENYGISEEISFWAVETIALALGLKNEELVIEMNPREKVYDIEHNLDDIEIIRTAYETNQMVGTSAENEGKLIYVESGEFKMGDLCGDGYSDEKPIHRVTLTYDFYLGKYPVTFEEYDKYCMSTRAKRPDDSNWGRGRRPVINVSSWDAISYCNWLSEKEKFPRAYDIKGNPLDKDGRITTDPSKVVGYRLPTEAEWEYAARGGNKSKGYKYSGSDNADDVAWYASNSKSMTQEVGKKEPNELEIYDMSGNVWEWCSDWYDSRFYSRSQKSNAHNCTIGSYRVIRGGCWLSFELYVRLAIRFDSSPEGSSNSVGFRIARTVF